MIAITRGVGPHLDRCELSFRERAEIDLPRARAQHRAYEELLRELGCEVIALEADPALPDAVFVEDVAVVLDEIAVVARPGAASRRPETRAVAAALAKLRPLAAIEPPATLDGGDVLRTGRTLWVGRSARTNAEGSAQLAAIARPLGYELHEVPVRGCLHLKSAVAEVAPGTLLIQPAWVDPRTFSGYRILEVDSRESHAANALPLGGAVVYPASHPRTRAILEGAGLDVRAVDVSELEKAEGSVTCCSLILEGRAAKEGSP